MGLIGTGVIAFFWELIFRLFNYSRTGKYKNGLYCPPPPPPHPTPPPQNALFNKLDSYLLTGDVLALAILPVFWAVFSPSRGTTSTGCAGVTGFHGLLVLLAIATQVTVRCSPADVPLGTATAHAAPLNLGAIGRPYAALSTACCTA